MIKIEVDKTKINAECDPSVGLNELRSEAVTAIHAIVGTVATVSGEEHKDVLADFALLAMATSEAFVDSSNKIVFIAPGGECRADD